MSNDEGRTYIVREGSFGIKQLLLGEIFLVS